MDEFQQIAEELLSGIKEIKELLQKQPTIDKNRSATTKELFTALALAQSEIRLATNNKENPYFKSKYADIAKIIEVSRPALTKNGLSVIQQLLTNDEGQIVLHTLLCHSSGEWIESQIKIIPPKNDIQTFGSYTDFLRRISYASLVGVVAEDDDDDAEIAIAPTRELKARGTALNTKYNPRENRIETITKEQIDELEYELAQYPDIVDDILDGLKIQNLADMPKERFLMAIKRIREIKALRDGN